MIKSMTGYGKAEASLKAGKLTIEIRTLNGKTADVNIKSTLLPKDKELIVRQMLAEKLHRGTIDFFVTFEANAVSSAKHINADLAEEYFRQITTLGDKLGIPVDTALYMNSILRFPDVIDNTRQDIITEENWLEVEAAIEKAIENTNEFRAREGVALYKDVTGRVNNILKLEDEVESFEGERIVAVRSKIEKAISDLLLKPDQSRFEEEMIYYLEKLDINEEKVRLRQHCKYFMDTIDGEDFPGKKLGFIIQEMGREINTTGSKANHAGIQKVVVRMKDELEKIREQSMNIL
ncbi:MAG: YicC family protein [Bacteroides sp.]|nr:YicC family protein [Bacteroides sp.]MCI7663847.1 YicC family protein [Bacteroides sp.]